MAYDLLVVENSSRSVKNKPQGAYFLCCNSYSIYYITETTNVYRAVVTLFTVFRKSRDAVSNFTISLRPSGDQTR